MADSLHLYMEPRGHRNSGVMGPLEGLRVVEFASDIAGPSAQSCSPTSAPMSPRSSHRQEIDSGARGRPFPGSVLRLQSLRSVRVPQCREARGDNRSR